jgi:hypothetical protein
MEIKVTYLAVDGCRKTRTFKTLKGARKFAQERIGAILTCPLHYQEHTEEFEYMKKGEKKLPALKVMAEGSQTPVDDWHEKYRELERKEFGLWFKEAVKPDEQADP